MGPIKCFLVVDTGKWTNKTDSETSQRVWKRLDTGEEITIFPPGAMWFYDDPDNPYPKGEDGKTLFCETPGGTWSIDSRCSNCDMPNDNKHKCWPRRGEAPMITVDKNFGNTCTAGAGSILMKTNGWHGFLREGYLIDA